MNLSILTEAQLLGYYEDIIFPENVDSFSEVDISPGACYLHQTKVAFQRQLEAEFNRRGIPIPEWGY